VLSNMETTTPPRAFDAIIIGTGQAGPSLAARLSAAGMTVAIIERNLVGGTCINTGCTPTKAMVASAYAARMAARAAEYGVILPGPARIDMAAVAARVATIVDTDRQGLEHWLTGLPGCTLIRGHARFDNAHQVRVGGQLLTADRIFINVGGRALVPDFPGLAEVPYLTNTDMVALRTVPRHLAVIGGSYVGLEFAQIFRRLGAQVTIVEKGPRLIGREDEDVSAQVQAMLEEEGIAMRLDAECIRIHKHADGALVGVDCASGDREFVASHVLLAVGRRPNTDDLGLDKAGIAVDGKGYIVVDGQLRSTANGVWALGDCNGRGAFTHTAYNDFEIVAANLLDQGDRSVDARIPVYALYTDPPLGRVGMTVAQAKQAGKKVRVGMRPMTRVARAIEKGETRGSMQVVVDAETDAILGAAILGPGGDEAVHMVLAAMAAGTTATGMTRTMAIHPTVSELIPTIFGELK